MGLIQVPDRKIFGNFKPDFPIEIDYTNSLAQLAVAAIFPEYGDFVSKNQTHPYGLVSSTIGARGREVLSPGGTADGAYINGANALYKPATALTFHFAGNFSSLVAHGSVISIPYAAGTWLTPWQVGLGGDGNGYLQIFLPITSSTFTYASLASAFVAGWHSYTVVWPASGNVSFYRDGLLVGTVAPSSGNAFNFGTAQQPINLLNNSNTVNGGAQPGELSFVYMALTALSSQQISSLSNNPYQIVRARQSDLMLTVVSGNTNTLTGAAGQTQTETATVSLAIPIVGASVQQQSGSAAISTGVAISGSATATQQANGSLSVSIPLSGASIQQAATTGTVSISVSLAGNAIQQAYASGTLTNTAAGAVNLSGTSSQSQSANGLLSLGNNLSGSSIAVSNASGSLTVLVPLSGVSVQAQQATGSLIVTATGVNLSGEAVQQALATGSLTMRINLSGESIQQAISSAYLSASGGMVSNPRWTINASGRNWTINAAGRNWTI